MTERKIRKILFLDVETTGLDAAVDRITEICIVLVACWGQRSYRVLSSYSQVADPGMPIPPQVSQLTGLDNELCAGLKFSPAIVKHLVSQAEFVVNDPRVSRSHARIDWRNGSILLVDVSTIAMPAQQHLQHILGLKEAIDLLGRQRHLALAQPVQQRLQHMGDARHVGQAEGSGAALDRMRHTENGIDVGHVECRRVEAEQQVLLLGQQLFGLVKEDLEKLTDLDAHASTPGPMHLPTTSSKRLGSKGLTSQPLAPASRPLFFISGLDSVVSIRIGT